MLGAGVLENVASTISVENSIRVTQYGCQRPSTSTQTSTPRASDGDRARVLRAVGWTSPGIRTGCTTGRHGRLESMLVGQRDKAGRLARL